MSATFKKGEIALHIADPANTPDLECMKYNGQECIVVSALGMQGVYWNRETVPRSYDWGILVRMADGMELIVLPHELRKRSAPPTTGEQSIRALFDAPPVERRQPATAWQAQYDTAQALMQMGVRVRSGKWPVEVEA